MRLSDKDIHKYIEDGELVIIGTNKEFPFDRYKQVQPCSIDLRLGNRFLKFKKEIKQFDVCDLENVWNYLESYEYQVGEQIIVEPHQILFGQIYEQLRLPSDCSGLVEGRSRFARLGLSVHATGGFINPEFEGAMPLQIINNNNVPLVIYPFMGVCQLILVKTSTTPLVAYPKRSDNPYHKEKNAGPSISHTDPAINEKYKDLPNLNLEIEKRLVDKYLKEIEYSKLKEQIKMEEQKSSETKGNTIIIKDSQFGAINTGTVSRDIKTKINSIKEEGQREQIAHAMEELTNLIEESKKINEENKVEGLKLIEELINQLQTNKEKRNSKPILKAVTNQLGTIIKNVTSKPDFWENTYKTISEFFGF